jgi:hypothetical protein
MNVDLTRKLVCHKYGPIRNTPRTRHNNVEIKACVWACDGKTKCDKG